MMYVYCLISLCACSLHTLVSFLKCCIYEGQSRSYRNSFISTVWRTMSSYRLDSVTCRSYVRVLQRLRNAVKKRHD
jgi:hypothetical protein